MTDPKLPTDPNEPSGSAGLDVLARFLEDIPDKKYHHAAFTQGGVRSRDDLLDQCGTAACALGFLPCIPEFRQRGWDFNSFGPCLLSVKGRRRLGPLFGAVKEFGITSEQFGRVFGFAGYKARGEATRTEVIAAIRKLADELREDGR